MLLKHPWLAVNLFADVLGEVPGQFDRRGSRPAPSHSLGLVLCRRSCGVIEETLHPLVGIGRHDSYSCAILAKSLSDHELMAG